MITTRAGMATLALVASSALVLSACSTNKPSGTAASNGSAPVSAGTSNKTFTWAVEQEYASYNGNTSQGNSSANAVINGPVIGGFWQFKPDGTLLANTDFGTYEKTSDSPLTVKYTINEKAAWSDGDPVDCDDFALAWLANSGTTGEKGFSAASTSGYKDQTIACKPGEKTVTVTYKKSYSDWAALYGPAVILPAHIVEKNAGMTKKFTDYLATPTSPDLAKAIAFYNSGFDAKPGELKKDIMLSSGPYMLDSWSAGQSMTLKANPKFWGTPAKTGTVVVRYLGGPSMAQALQNGEVQAMDPQPQVDIVNQLKALGDSVAVTYGTSYTFEHFDFNFKGTFKDKNMRMAFAKCVPRQLIVDNLIKPVNADAKIFQSRFIFPFQTGYDDYIKGIGGQDYDTQDIEGAKKLLNGATPTVRVGWRKDPEQLNKRRVDQLALLQSECGKAGFKIVDAGTKDFFAVARPAGNFDVAMFAWAGSPLVSQSYDIYHTGGGDNPNGYGNPEVDKLLDQLNSETDTNKQREIQKQIDTLLWSDLATIPLYAFPAVMANVKTVGGLQQNATQADLSWNMQDWTVS